jgi:hypothetical protein
MSDMQSDLYYNLKNKLNVIDTAQWTWNLTDILRDDFLKKGMSYDIYQSICKGE